MDFHNFYIIYVFKVKESNADIPDSYWAIVFHWPRNSKSTSGLIGTDDTVL